ncbi:MAG TPA: glycosyltransferase family 4 protein [Anaerolineae bacterium]|nr:glycosyltransferase family 4 protein [Anaerolineae bacterium]
MRILMLNNEFPPLGGGTGVVNYHLLEELASYQEVWVDLVTSSRSHHDYETERFAKRITIYKTPVDNHNIHHATNQELLRYSWRGLLKSRELLKQQRYNLSFAFAGVPAGAISYALKLSHKLPYLVSLQGADIPGFEARYNWLYPLLKPVLRRIWRNAGVVTAISKQHQLLAHQTMPELDIPIIYNGVNTQTFQPFDYFRQDLEINILCVGRLIERKGQHHLLRAFANLCAIYDRPLRLILAGTGDAEAALHRLATDLGVAEQVNFIGFVSRNDMPTVYPQADIFVLASQNEGMSIALLEAMASGLPVVVTDTGGTAELVREDLNGYTVPWADVSKLTEALAKLVKDQEIRQQMGRESRRVASQFSWPAITRQYVDLCEDIVAQSRPASTPARWLPTRDLIFSDK